MTGTPSTLAELLVECEADGIRFALADDGRLEIDAPQDALTPDLLGRLKAHKADLRAILRRDPAAAMAALADVPAQVVWRVALDQLDGDPLFPPVRIEALRAANARWSDAEPSSKPATKAEDASATKITRRVCGCGSTTWRDVRIQGGQSIRRDCRRCGKFLKFHVWHGNDTLQKEKQRIRYAHGQKENKNEANQFGERPIAAGN